MFVAVKSGVTTIIGYLVNTGETKSIVLTKKRALDVENRYLVFDDTLDYSSIDWLKCFPPVDFTKIFSEFSRMLEGYLSQKDKSHFAKELTEAHVFYLANKWLAENNA